MQQSLERLCRDHHVGPGDILYIVHSEGWSRIHTLDGEVIQTKIPVKHLFEQLPQEDFLSIQKGTLVSRSHVMEISDDGVYTMVDGVQFQGRRRNLAQHKRNRQLLHRPAGNGSGLPLTLLEKCSILDDAPIAFCVIELVFGESGVGFDFIFRYCNREMENLEGKTLEEMVNQSFYQVFPNGDKKWLIPYSDVALNGTRRVINDYSPEVQKHLTIQCFQPQYGYCACFLTENSGVK